MKKTGWASIMFAAMLLAVAAIAEAQQPKKVHRIGYLSVLDPARESARAEAIRLALRKLGYIEGQNIAPSSSAMGRGSKIDTLSCDLSATVLGTQCDPHCLHPCKL
jgi:hypothetical protein